MEKCGVQKMKKNEVEFTRIYSKGSLSRIGFYRFPWVSVGGSEWNSHMLPSVSKLPTKRKERLGEKERVGGVYVPSAIRQTVRTLVNIGSFSLFIR